MSETNANTGTVLKTERTISASPAQIFEAFRQPEKLARWWGPAGFTNTFEVFNFVPGGLWKFVMHAPNGTDYPNECVFREIEPESRVVIDHVAEPHFTLTISLRTHDAHTHLTWEQAFKSAEVAEKLRSMCEPANEQNLDRLEMVLAGK